MRGAVCPRQLYLQIIEAPIMLGASSRTIWNVPEWKNHSEIEVLNMANVFERILVLHTPDGDRNIPISISSPVMRDKSWFADWEIFWPDRKRSGSGGGVDAIQALLSSLKMVGSELYCSEEHKTGGLQWGPEFVGYGFPVPNGLRDSLIGDDAKYF